MKLSHIPALINNRLQNIETIIRQHKYCIDNNISIDQYKENLVRLEKEYAELASEYKILKQLK